MKTLHLLRHAKSSWDDPALDDHDRPLAPRGERAALALADHWNACGVRPDLVLCSTACRARQTLERILPSWDPPPAVRWDPGLYLTSAPELLERVQGLADAHASVLLVGHNPGLGELAALLAGSGDPALRRRLVRKYPTGAWVELRFAVGHWRDVGSQGGKLLRFVRPKELR
jgi:phosphohistidine phosphatase